MTVKGRRPPYIDNDLSKQVWLHCQATSIWTEFYKNAVEIAFFFGENQNRSDVDHFQHFVKVSCDHILRLFYKAVVVRVIYFSIKNVTMTSRSKKNVEPYDLTDFLFYLKIVLFARHVPKRKSFESMFDPYMYNCTGLLNFEHSRTSRFWKHSNK